MPQALCRQLRGGLLRLCAAAPARRRPLGQALVVRPAFACPNRKLTISYRYLAKTSTAPPPATLPAPPALFQRRYPSSRSYPPLPAGTALPQHSLTLTMPHVRLYSQLPPYGFHPLGWVFFAVVAAHPGPGMRYTLKDATGRAIPLQFVERWETGPGEPTGPEAEPFRNLKVGTMLCFNCPTWSLGMRGGREMSVEKLDLQGIKVRTAVLLDRGER